MKVTAVIQARMGSTRLAGKVLLTAAGKPLLQHQIERVRHSTLVNEIIVATTTKEEDDVIVNLCEKLPVKCFRGSELDVLDRYYQCAAHFGLQNIVRLTADNPLQEPEVIDKVIQAFLKNNCDYTSNTLKSTYPDGFDVEVFTFAALKRAWFEARTPLDREHVTPFLKNHPEIFKQVNIEDIIDRSSIRCTVDTREDYLFVKDIIENLSGIRPYFKYADMLSYLKIHPQPARR